MYTSFQVTLLVVMIVSVIKTWRDVHDHIFVRGELILQASLLSIVVVTQFGIFLVDAISTENEEYDELFYFCYFVLATVQCFCSVLVSTKYLVFRQWQSTRSTDRALAAKDDKDAHEKDADFKVFISTRRGFEAMLSHLALESQALMNNLVVQLFVYSLSLFLNVRLAKITENICQQCLVEIALVLDRSLQQLERGDEYLQWAHTLRALVLPPLNGVKSTICTKAGHSSTEMLHALHQKYFDKKAEWRVKLDDGSTMMDDRQYQDVYERGLGRRAKSQSARNLNLMLHVPSTDPDNSAEYSPAEMDSLPTPLTPGTSDGTTRVHYIKDIIEVLYNGSNTISKTLQNEFEKIEEAKVWSLLASF